MKAAVCCGLQAITCRFLLYLGTKQSRAAHARETTFEEQMSFHSAKDSFQSNVLRTYGAVQKDYTTSNLGKSVFSCAVIPEGVSLSGTLCRKVHRGPCSTLRFGGDDMVGATPNPSDRPRAPVRLAP
jgi:hypothetical protein